MGLLRYSRAALKCGDEQFYETCSFIIDTHLVLPDHSCILPSELAGSAVLLAQLLYKLSSALEMVKQMIRSCADNYKYRGVIGKYQSFSRHKRLALASHVQEDVLKKAKRTLLTWKFLVTLRARARKII